MEIRFVCPFGHRLVVPGHRAGKKGRCPVCNLKVIVPVQDPLSERGGAEPLWDNPAESPAEMAPRGEFVAAAAPVPLMPPAPGESHSASPVTAAMAPETPMPQPLSMPQPMPIPQAMPLPQPMPAGFAPGYAAPAPVPPGPYAPAGPYAAGVPAPAYHPAMHVAAPAMAAPIAGPYPYQQIPDMNQVAPGPEYSVDVNATPQNREGLANPIISRAGKGKQQTVYLLAVGLAIVVLASALPAFGHLNLAVAPGWARAVFLIAALQLVYVVWMVALPDWSTVWVGMWLFAVVAALYAMVWMIVVYTVKGAPMMLSLSDVRHNANGWCAIMVLLMSLMSYICGRISTDWRKAFEVAKKRSSIKNSLA